jgi:hypothetical protein
MQLTAQELIYVATALRAEAHRANVQASDPQCESSRAIFADAAKVYAELAGKLTRIAEGSRSEQVNEGPSISRIPTQPWTHR